MTVANTLTADAPPDLPAAVDTRGQQRAAAVITASLIVLGAVLGVIWEAWSPARPPGVRIPGGTVQYSETSESFAASDGRFALIVAIVGLAAGAVVWSRRSVRGPWVAFALAVGGLAGSWVMAEVGHLLGHGTNDGKLYTKIPHLPLSLHMTGLFAIEALLAVLVYSVLAAFAVDDDLGRPDPGRDLARRRPGVEPPRSDLIAPEYLVEYRGADGNGAGLPQQHEFPAQDPGDGA